MSVKKRNIFRLQASLLCNFDGYPTDFLITPANTDDRKPVVELLKKQEQMMNFLLADKGYTGSDFRIKVESETGISVCLLPKSGDYQPASEKSIRRFVFKKRRRIKTTNSQLVEQLNIQRVRVKSLWGLMTRLYSKFLAFDIAYLINVINGSKYSIKIKGLVF